MLMQLTVDRVVVAKTILCVYYCDGTKYSYEMSMSLTQRERKEEEERVRGQRDYMRMGS
jgi:hypothetical protein